jgi:hypothetical protein
VLDCTEIEKRMISGQTRGKLDNITPSRVKSQMLTYLTSKFEENYNKCFEKNDNETWFNDILRIETTLNPERHSLTLKYKDNYKHNGGKLVLETTMKLKSAYSECMKNILIFLKKGRTNTNQKYPFNKLTNFDDFESIEVNSIKMGFNSIDKTIDFVSKLTCEPPFSNYVKGAIYINDYIMYEGNMNVVRIYNVPDINIITQDIGPMPNSIFPSDHIPLIAEFIID